MSYVVDRIKDIIVTKLNAAWDLLKYSMHHPAVTVKK